MSERVTRSQTGKTPRKRLDPDFVETPGRRTRRTVSPIEKPSFPSPISEAVSTVTSATNGSIHTNGFTNGSLETPEKRGRGRPRKSIQPELGDSSTSITQDHKVDTSGQYEFGGPYLVTLLIIGFPLLMWYMWVGATHYDGKLPLPAPGEALGDFFKRLVSLAYQGAYPSAKAWAIYWTFFIVEGLFYLYLPGVYTDGKPLPHLGGKKLTYYCSGMWSFYTSIAIALGLHFSGIFKLYTLLDEFGPIMSVAIISGFLVSIIAYFSALARGAQHRMTGNFIYDFFMGAELNPRLLGWLDFKMFFEVRLPWYILFFISMAAAARQWENYGYVSGEVCFVLMAHFLYASACSKGEECITTTWDMYYEKWGFMLIFWNLAGVPLSYCHCTLYLANHDPKEYRWPTWALVLLYTSYLFVYWVWDTCNSQKNMFRKRERGEIINRKAFPQLPWKEVRKNPTTIPTATGDSLLCDGWYGLARKVHYTCDVYFAVTWALITGFNSPFPWFYPVFFVAMITHRAYRDITRCRERYGPAWEEYTRRVPYLFIPYVI